jgi:hypothetical protein
MLRRNAKTLLLALLACSCYGVVGDEGLSPPSDGGPRSTTGGPTTGGAGQSTGTGGSGGTTGTGGTTTGAGGVTGSGGTTGTGGATTGTGGATTGAGGATTGTGGATTGTGGATTGTGGATTGMGGGAGTGGTATGGAAGTGTGGTGTSGTGGTGVIDAGTGKGGAAGTGTGGAGGSTVDAAVPPICTSGTRWTTGENAMMRPGDACLTSGCHLSGTHAFALGGTVYPTLHEPLNCNGKSGVQVVITPASGAAITLTTNSAGNFYQVAKIATPYRAKVIVNGVEKAMMAAQTNGDCNSCHTQNGASSALGRIIP